MVSDSVPKCHSLLLLLFSVLVTALIISWPTKKRNDKKKIIKIKIN